MNYISPQPTVYSRIVGIFTWIWGKSFGPLIEIFKVRMCVPTWFATILWILLIGSFATAIWGIVQYTTGVKALTPKCAACPKDNQKLQGTYTILPAA